MVERLRAAPTQPEPAAGEPSPDDTKPFRPRLRASAAVLCILDDGSDASGETVWIRKDRFVIGGRDAGGAAGDQPDAVIANDGDISALHAELSRRWEDGRCWWTLKDLGSKNGTFLRIESAPLKYGDEVLIGHRVFRFDATRLRSGTPMEPGDPDDLYKTRGRQAFRAEDLQPPPPDFIEAASGDAGLRFSLSGSEQRIGREPACGIVLADDPTVSPEHARLFVNRGAWHIADCDSLNGVWLRISEKVLDPDTEFQLGQQRFLFRFSEEGWNGGVVA